MPFLHDPFLEGFSKHTAVHGKEIMSNNATEALNFKADHGRPLCYYSSVFSLAEPVHLQLPVTLKAQVQSYKQDKCAHHPAWQQPHHAQTNTQKRICSITEKLSQGTAFYPVSGFIEIQMRQILPFLYLLFYVENGMILSSVTDFFPGSLDPCKSDDLPASTSQPHAFA